MTNTTGRLNEACQLAQDALILAIAAVDAILDDNSAAIEYPELVVAIYDVRRPSVSRWR